jgi:hypothetical protein
MDVFRDLIYSVTDTKEAFIVKDALKKHTTMIKDVGLDKSELHKVLKPLLT